MTKPAIPQLERRRIEAELLMDIYEAGLEDMGEKAMLALIGKATSASAIRTGRAFATTAPDGPSLEHFSTIMEVWKKGGAVDFVDERLTPTTWSFKVTRCGYQQAYAKMGLPPGLGFAASCLRDGSFARGYSEKLAMSRPETIAQGHACCKFIFTWEQS